MISRKGFLLHSALALTCAAGAFAGWHLQQSSEKPSAKTKAGPSFRPRPAAPASVKGAAQLSSFAARVEACADRDLKALAEELARDPQRNDADLWTPLLARWSESDAPAMIDFLENSAPKSIRPQLLKLGWHAWGASDPDAAFLASKNQSTALAHSMIQGIAEADPEKAAKRVLQVPDSHDAVRLVAKTISGKAPQAADRLLARAIYDGGRMPFQDAKISQLAASDPAAAVAYARSVGAIAHDSVPIAIGKIAAHDPSAAATQIGQMPSSRSKALSEVALAKSWAAQDPEAAASWIRDHVNGPARHYSLVAAAAASAPADPSAALDLLNEAGWDPQPDFFRINDWSVVPSEATTRPDPQSAAADILRRIAANSPEQARQYLKKIPASRQADVATKAGLNP